jgi:hypothetical protein
MRFAWSSPGKSATLILILIILAGQSNYQWPVQKSRLMCLSWN